MEKLKYSVMSSLKEISLKNVTIILWSQPEILASLEEIGVESKVEDNMRKLELPAELMEQIKFLVKPIGIDIRNWKKFHEVYLESENLEMLSFVKRLCWIQSLGVIDYKKTAENVIRYEMFDSIKLYKLACLYCLEEYISVLWGKVSLKCKKYICKEPFELTKPQSLPYILGTKEPFELTKPQSWPYILETKEPNIYNFFCKIVRGTTPYNEHKFKLSANMGNKSATEYFYKKLTSEIREDLLSKVILDFLSRLFPFYGSCEYKFPKEKLTDNVIYLLSLMRPEKQIEILKSKPQRILQCLLDWPRQDLFLSTAESIWNCLDASDYLFLLNIIAEKIRSGYYFAKIFEDFFLRGSRDFIKYFVKSESQNVVILDVLFKAQLSETVKMIFKNLDPKSRKKLIFSRAVFDFFNDLFLKRQLDPIQLCLYEATLSEEEKEELKKAYFGYLNTIVTLSDSLKESIRGLFLEYLFDNGVRLPCKRKFED